MRFPQKAKSWKITSGRNWYIFSWKHYQYNSPCRDLAFRFQSLKERCTLCACDLRYKKSLHAIEEKDTQQLWPIHGCSTSRLSPRAKRNKIRRNTVTHIVAWILSQCFYKIKDLFICYIASILITKMGTSYQSAVSSTKPCIFSNFFQFRGVF